MSRHGVAAREEEKITGYTTTALTTTDFMEFAA